ncbi:MAG: hypothetical protein J6X60_03850, partial [Ruminiclostridium sp.]|nr:hypothetical protein [Ruminiclostridium sp.]
MEAGFNNFNYNSNGSSDGDLRQNAYPVQEQQPVQQTYTAPQPEKKKKGGRFLKAAAIVAAVAIIA